MRALLNANKFSSCLAFFQAVADFGVPNLAHAATERIAYQESFIYNGLALEVFVPREGDSLIRALIGGHCVLPNSPLMIGTRLPFSVPNGGQTQRSC
jgi:hypothetical protein